MSDFRDRDLKAAAESLYHAGVIDCRVYEAAIRKIDAVAQRGPEPSFAPGFPAAAVLQNNYFNPGGIRNHP